LPRYLFNASLGGAASLIVHEESIAVTSVSVNKRTGSFVVPELAIVGTWGELETLLTAWFHNRNARRTEARRGKNFNSLFKSPSSRIYKLLRARIFWTAIFSILIRSQIKKMCFLYRLKR
jgi:hypothetical protein